MRRRNEKKEKEKGGTPTASPTASPKPQKTSTPQSPKSSKETKEEPKRTKENEPIQQEAKSSKETPPIKEETKKIEKIDEQKGKKAEQIPEQLKGSTFIQQEFVQEWQILRDMFKHSSYLMLLIEFCSFIPHLLSLILVHFPIFLPFFKTPKKIIWNNEFFCSQVLRFFLGGHNVWVLVFFLGIVVNKAVNYILKHIFCQPRPAAAKRYGKTGYGMP